MKKNREEILTKLNKLSNGKKSKWIDDAKWRLENEAWLAKSQAIAVVILRKLRANKTNNLAPSSQLELAKVIGVSAQQVNKWVKGNENFTLETISKLEMALEIELFSVPKPIQKQTTVDKTIFIQLLSADREEVTYRKDSQVITKKIKVGQQNKWNAKKKYTYS